MGRRIGREQLWHEADLDKRPDAVGQQTVVDLIDVAEVIAGFPVIVLVVHTHFVVQDPVKADVFKPGNAFDVPEILAITFPQRKDRPA